MEMNSVGHSCWFVLMVTSKGAGWRSKRGNVLLDAKKCTPLWVLDVLPYDFQ